MRDSFAKELAIQRGKSGQSAIKKKKYVHFDSLLFLVPSIQKRETSSNLKSPSQDYPEIDIDQNLPPTNSIRTPSCKRASKTQSNNDVYEQKLLDYLTSKENPGEYDEDINFSQMVVPMLRKLNDEQKHFAKIEIMNILQRAKAFHPSVPPTQGSRSHMPFMQTSSPHSCYTYSPSPSPTMSIHSPLSTPPPGITSISSNKPRILHQEIISTGQQFITAPGKQTI